MEEVKYPMNKIKQVFCKHEYTFFPNQLNGLGEKRKVRAICNKCYKNFELSYDEYKKLKQEQEENKQDKQDKQQEEVN